MNECGFERQGAKLYKKQTKPAIRPAEVPNVRSWEDHERLGSCTPPRLYKSYTIRISFATEGKAIMRLVLMSCKKSRGGIS